MTGFKLNNGDLVITNNEIELVEGDELTAQTIQQVVSTNKGEWLFDTEEGINFDNILGKHQTNDESTIRSEIEQGTEQVDPTLTITDFATYFDKENRKLTVGLNFKKPTGETVEVNVAYDK